MPSTTNFGWTTPADTNYVKNGAADMRTLANGIDSSLVDLKGGTTNQVLAKNSNTDLDYKWMSLAPVLISTTTLTGTTVTISSIPSGYSVLRVHIYGVNPTSTSSNIDFRCNPNDIQKINNAYTTNQTNYQNVASEIFLGNINGSQNIGENSWIIEFYDYDSSHSSKSFHHFGGGPLGADSIYGAGTFQDTAAITSLKFRTVPSSGTAGFDAGTVKLYGVR